MRVVILGTGGVALAYVAYLTLHGHEPVCWSPSGKGIKAFEDGAELTATGTFSFSGKPRCARTCADAVEDAEVVIIAVPGNGHRAVIDAMAPHLTERHTVIISSHCSFGALYLSKLLSERGVRVPIAAWATTAIMGRRAGTSVIIGGVRKELDVAALPVSATDHCVAVCRQLFGDRFRARADVLAISLSNLNPPIHLANSLCNLTRIERAEYWANYDCITPAVGRLIEALDVERLALAKACDVSVRTVKEHYYLTFDFAPGRSVSEMAAAVHERRKGPPGPTTLETRFITEDVPFGLVPLLRLGRIVHQELRLHMACIAVISALYDRDFESENDILPRLDLDGMSISALHAIICDGWKAKPRA
jgi:opine dehydrogenase